MVLLLHSVRSYSSHILGSPTRGEPCGAFIIHRAPVFRPPCRYRSKSSYSLSAIRHQWRMAPSQFIMPYPPPQPLLPGELIHGPITWQGHGSNPLNHVRPNKCLRSNQTFSSAILHFKKFFHSSEFFQHSNILNSFTTPILFSLQLPFATKSSILKEVCPNRWRVHWLTYQIKRRVCHIHLPSEEVSVGNQPQKKSFYVEFKAKPQYVQKYQKYDFL